MATWIDSSVDLTTEVAFDSGPWDTSPVWEDVSDLVRNVETDRGSSSEAAVFTPGSMRVTFSNGARQFDPDNASGPYAGKVVPMKRIRVTATRSAVTFTVFLGWVIGWQQGWGHTDGVAYADCVDGGYFVQSETLAGSAYAAEVLADAPVAYWPLQYDFRDVIDGKTFGDSFSPGRVPATFGEVAYPLGQPSAVIGGDPGSTYQANDSFGSLHAIEAWMTVASGSSVSLSVRSGADGRMSISWDTAVDRFFFGYENAADNVGLAAFVPATLFQTPANPGLHHVALHATPTTLTFVLDGQPVFSHTFTAADTAVSDEYAAILADVGTTISHVAIYETAPSLDRIKAHYLAGSIAYGHPYGEREGERITRCLDEIGYPTNLRDISPGTVVVGPYLPAERTAMEYVGDCVTAGQGLLFFDVEGKLCYRDRRWQWHEADADGVVFSDDGADVSFDQGSPLHTVETVRNIVTVSYSDVGAITNRDATSIDDYGPSREFIDAPLIPNGTTASNLGKYVLRIKKDPKSTIPELLVKMRANVAGHFAPVLGLEIGEVVTVERTPMGVGSQIVRRHQVTGVSHRITPDNWETRFYLSPAVPMADEVPYFTLGDPVYGRLGTAAGNKIPG